jgi:prepilin-type N-terminal cleavage/methylation domain-containing protein
LDLKARRGVSLIEILVVLVILVIGIFAISRLFPEAFISLNYAGDVTNSGALLKATEDELRDRAENLPDAIVSIDPNTGLVRPSYDIFAEVAYTDNPVKGWTGPAAGPVDPRYSYVNQARRVIGEPLRVPPPTLDVNLGGAPGESASLYRCNFSPIYSDVLKKGSSLAVAAISDVPYRRVVLGAQPQTDQEWLDLYDLLDAYSYAVVYDTGVLYFRKTRFDRAFKVDYSYRVPTGPGTYTVSQSIPSNYIFVPGVANVAALPPGIASITPYNLRASATVNTAQGIFVYQAPPVNAVFDPESDQLYRKLRQIIPKTGLFDGPAKQPLPPGIDHRFFYDYAEFKVYDTIYGLFGFNPALASVSLQTRQEGRTPSVRLDYDVDDWFILHEDVVVPTHTFTTGTQGTTYYPVKLATGAIKKVGDPEDFINLPTGAGGGQVNATLLYEGLVRSYPAGNGKPNRDGTPGIDVVVVDMQSGLSLDSRTLQPVPGADQNGEIDYNNGVIKLRQTVRFNQPGGIGSGSGIQVPAGGRHLRIYYRTFHDMAVAAYKPSGSYYRKAFPARLGAQEFSPYAFGYLLFPDSERERTVLVDYTWQNKNTGEVQLEVGELHRLEPPGNPLYAPGPVGGGNPPSNYWVRLSHADPDNSKSPDPSADPDVVPGSISIRSVRGASLHTHVMFRSGNRWRHVERSTILTRAGGGL